MKNLKKVLIVLVSIIALAGVITTFALYFTTKKQAPKKQDQTQNNKKDKKVSVIYNLK